MNIVNTLGRAGYEFLVINVIALPFAMGNPITIAWYALCVLLAFVLRVGMEHKSHRLTKASLLYQSICTIAWSFFSILVWNTFLNYIKGFEIYLFINSLFASFMVSQFEEVFELGFKRWLKMKLSTFLATQREEDTTP